MHCEFDSSGKCKESFCGRTNPNLLYRYITIDILKPSRLTLNILDDEYFDNYE
jgi:hypothetical protein